MKVEIKATKDLYNGGKCFTKGEVYEVEGPIHNEATLMERTTTNDQGQPHIIGSWWRNFKIV